jgi:hypothetical protein
MSIMPVSENLLLNTAEPRAQSRGPINLAKNIDNMWRGQVESAIGGIIFVFSFVFD